MTFEASHCANFVDQACPGHHAAHQVVAKAKNEGSAHAGW